MFLRLLSALARILTDCSLPIIKNCLISLFVRLYKPNMREAAYPNSRDYASFNAFFARPLRAGARPIAQTPFVAPVDGRLINTTQLQNGRIPTIKGQTYDLNSLLLDAKQRDNHQTNSPSAGTYQPETFNAGLYALFYLSPKDYHRVHCPCDATLTRLTFIPGRLRPVNDFAARRVPLLYAQNQRAVFWFDTPSGKMVVVMIAALFVSSIETKWGGRHHALASASARELNIPLTRGDELGRFLMGSSVILLTEHARLALAPNLGPQTRVGQPLFVAKT